MYHARTLGKKIMDNFGVKLVFFQKNSDCWENTDFPRNVQMIFPSEDYQTDVDHPNSQCSN